MPDPAVQVEAQALLERGAGLYEAGKLYEALACWKQVLDLDPGNEIATEYLRFIEDNFQIGVDAFIAQHQAVSAPPPPPPPVAQPSQSFGEEALGDLDWSEILEDPEQGSLPPKGSAPVAVADLEEDDEDFFSELEPGSINAEPGDEAIAWAADSSRPSEAPAPAAYTPPPMEGDPLAMDVSAFSAPVSSPPPLESTPPTPMGAPPTREDRDLAQMSDDSIEVMLDQDFKAWEEEDLTEASPALEAHASSRPTGAYSPTVDEDADFFARPFAEATPPPLPAPLPDDSLDIGQPPSQDEDLSSPALRTPPPRRVAEVVKTPPPAQISAPPPDPDEVPFEMGGDDAAAGASVEIPLDGMLEAAEAEERVESLTSRETGEDPFAALEEAFSSLSAEVSEAEQVFDELHEAVAPSRPPAARPPEGLGLQPPPPPPGSEPINFDESMPVMPAGVAADSVEYLEDGDHSLPDVDFAMVEASVAEGDPAPPFVDPDDDDPLPDFDLGEAPLNPAAFDLEDDAGPVDFELGSQPGAAAFDLDDDDPVDFELDSEAGDEFDLGGPEADFALDSQPGDAFNLDEDPMPVDFDLGDDEVDFVLEGEPEAAPSALPPARAVPDFDLGPAPVAMMSPSTPPPAPEMPPPQEAIAPPRAEVTPAAPAAPSGLEDLLRQGLADIEAVESGAERPEKSDGIRQLIKPPPPGTDFDELMKDARRRQQAGDFTGSLELVEAVLSGRPDHAEALAYLQENTTRLLAMYRSRLGKLSKVPKLKLRPQEIIWQSLDHRAGFVLAQVDGMTSYEDIIEIASMPGLEATRILARLVDHGVIG